MKINKYIIATFMGAASLTSCEDFLTVDIKKLGAYR